MRKKLSNRTRIITVDFNNRSVLSIEDIDNVTGKSVVNLFTTQPVVELNKALRMREKEASNGKR